MINKVFATMGALAVLAGALASGCVIVAGGGDGGSGGAIGVGGAGGAGQGGAGGAGGAGQGGTGGTGGAAACTTCGENQPSDFGSASGPDVKMFCTMAASPNGLDSQTLIVDLYNCACAQGGACADVCLASLCAGMAPDVDKCAPCINDDAAGCGKEFGACSADAPM